VLRPVWFEQPDDHVGQGVADEALLGADLLVAPVLAAGVDRRPAWLPPGSWTDFRTDETHGGRRWTELDASLDDLVPILARGGSIIPTAPPMRWSDERPLDPLTLHVFPDAAGAADGSLYEDDGVSMEHIRGVWCETRFSATRDRDGVMSVNGVRSGPFLPPPRSVDVVVHAGGSRNVEVTVPDAEEWTVTVRP
jgi:alpha-glucosidase